MCQSGEKDECKYLGLVLISSLENREPGWIPIQYQGQLEQLHKPDMELGFQYVQHNNGRKVETLTRARAPDPLMKSSIAMFD